MFSVGILLKEHFSNTLNNRAPSIFVKVSLWSRVASDLFLSSLSTVIVHTRKIIQTLLSRHFNCWHKDFANYYEWYFFPKISSRMNKYKLIFNVKTASMGIFWWVVLGKNHRTCVIVTVTDTLHCHRNRHLTYIYLFWHSRTVKYFFLTLGTYSIWLQYHDDDGVQDVTVLTWISDPNGCYIASLGTATLSSGW